MNEIKRISKSVAQKRSERCRYFNGVQHKICEAGISYADLEKVGTLPCLPWHVANKPTAACDKYAVFSPEEIAKQEAELEAHLVQIKKVMVSIKPLREQVKATGQSFAGRIDCAACGGKGTLALNICSYNGHARGGCQCGVGWVE
jgi:hypothetical protein